MITRINIRRSTAAQLSGSLPITPIPAVVNGGFNISGQKSSIVSKKAVLMSGTDSFTFDIISPETNVDDAAQIEWTEIPRPGELPNLAKSARRLRKYGYKATIYKNGAPIDVDLQRLQDFTGRTDKLTFSYGAYDIVTCRMLTLTIEPKLRQAGTNNVISADVSFVLTTVNDIPVPRAVPNAPPPPTPTPETPKGDPPKSQYTVKRGDTLWAIAQKHYGAGQSYPRIASANNIKNVNRIFPGQVLTIP